VTCPDAAVVLAKYDHLMDLLDKFESKIFASWAASVAENCERNLKHSLLTRNAVNKELSVNFHPEVNSFIALHFIIWVIFYSIIYC
jgi:dynein heavy chain